MDMLICYNLLLIKRLYLLQKLSDGPTHHPPPPPKMWSEDCQIHLSVQHQGQTMVLRKTWKLC